MSELRTRRPILWTLFVMSRPDQLALIAVVYGLGTVIALARGRAFSGANALLGLLAILLVSTSVHYVNEYADYFADYLAERTPYSGGSGALQRTGLPRRLAADAAVPFLAGGLLVALGGAVWDFPVVAVALLALVGLVGWGYSVGPAFAWRGLGELANAFLGGIALPVYGFAVQAGRATPDAVSVCVPFAILVFLNLLATTWPDRAADGAVGKRTLATRWSTEALRATYALGVLAWLGALVWLHGRGMPTPVVLGNAAALPFLLVGFRWYTRRRSPFPTVAAMVLTAVSQFVGWGWIALRAA